ncbi:MAG: hypothetical protein BWY91_02384 [bacterium ADurb.BinA028]|nr:MAG: hypothetical protein BWY91_02384 [bacterium ADurb.BinA028]
MTRVAGARGSAPIRRRAVVRGAAWSVPVVVLAVAAPAVAASCTYAVSIVNTLAASAFGFDLYIKDTKFGAVPSTTAPFKTGTRMPVLTLLVTCNGVPAVGAPVAIAGDGQTDIEGIPLLKFVSPTITTNVLEGTAVPSPYSSTTSATGQVQVAIATATFMAADPKPRIGVFTVTVGAQVFTFSYSVFDG